MNKRNLTIGIIVALICFSPSLFAQQPLAQSAADVQVSAGRISLDIKNMDIIDVLKILSMRGDLNIVAGKNVRGKVTLFLRDVEVMDALEIILAANGMAFEQKGNIINVMTERDYELLYGEKSYDKKVVKIIRLKFAKAVDLSKSLTEMKTKIGKVVVDQGSNTIVLIDLPAKIREMEEAVKNMDLPTETRTFVLNYAKVEDLKEKIKESLSANLGEVKIDERMNKIIVTDLPEKVEYVSRIISDFDEKDDVVLIEAKIISITLNKDIGYGVNWNNVFAGIDTIAQSDLSFNLSGVSSTATFTYSRAHGATEYGDQIILRLLDTVGKTDVLSTPRITVANNEEAKVLVGTKEAYVTSTVTQSDGTTTTADNVEFVDVGVSLSVTPTISRNGYIKMKIKPEVSSAPTSLELTNSDGSVRTSVPIVTTSEAETQLLVKDGTTIIMAGLMKDTRKDNREKIPFLGDIPVLGHIFQSRGQEDVKTELVIFLTPHILQDGTDDSVEAAKYLQRHDSTGVKIYDGLDYELDETAVLEEFSAEAEEYWFAENEQLGEDEEFYLDSGAERSIEEEAQEALIEEVQAIKPQPANKAAKGPGDFQEYCNYISEQIAKQLQKNIPSGVKQQEAQLTFVLTRDGSLAEQPTILNAMDRKTEALIAQSVEESTPFPPFPEDYPEPEEVFNLTVSFGE